MLLGTLAHVPEHLTDHRLNLAVELLDEVVFTESDRMRQLPALVTKRIY
jgi:hypothetical protein